MTVATIVVIVIGLLLIGVSFLLTSNKDEKAEAEEKTTPGLRDELSEADKKQLDHIRHIA